MYFNYYLRFVFYNAGLYIYIQDYVLIQWYWYVSSSGLGMPDTLKDHFDLLVKHDIIPNDSGKKLQAMVEFRNIAVHEYQNIDNEILKSILQNNLRDIEEFYKIILIKFEWYTKYIIQNPTFVIHHSQLIFISLFTVHSSLLSVH